MIKSLLSKDRIFAFFFRFCIRKFHAVASLIATFPNRLSKHFCHRLMSTVFDPWANFVFEYISPTSSKWWKLKKIQSSDAWVKVSFCNSRMNSSDAALKPLIAIKVKMVQSRHTFFFLVIVFSYIGSSYSNVRPLRRNFCSQCMKTGFFISSIFFWTHISPPTVFFSCITIGFSSVVL